MDKNWDEIYRSIGPGKLVEQKPNPIIIINLLSTKNLIPLLQTLLTAPFIPN